MITKKNSYAALVVTFNRKELLIEAINAILGQTISADSIVIVDNASTDGTKDYLLDNGVLNNPKIHFIELKENLGGSGGFYYGLNYIQKNLSVDWVALSDDDAIYDRNYFKNIFELSRDNPDIGAFAGAVKFPDGELQLGHRKYVSDNGRFSTQDIDSTKYQMSSFKADFASFVGLVLSMQIISKIGLPNKEYFIWFDDLEYSIRIKKETGLLINSKAVITHKTQKNLHGQNKKLTYNWKNYYGIRNRISMIKEHSINGNLSVKVLLGILKNLTSILFSKSGKGQKKKIVKQYLSGMKDGIKGKLGKNEQYLP
ncbi:glycosyltransferase [Latilactobacillus sakei]